MRKPITPGQFDQVLRVAKDAGEPTMEVALTQMRDDGQITFDGLQHVLGKGDLMRRKLIAAWKTIIVELAEEMKPLLRLISGGKKVVIPVCDGKRNFVVAREIFKWYFDADFVNWGLDVPSEPTLEAIVEVHEQVGDGNFKNILTSTGEPVEDLFFTQAQALAFVETNAEWLGRDYATFIPFKVKVNGVMNFFVARVFGASVRGLHAHVHRFSDAYVRQAEYRPRFVLPQLAAPAA